MTESRRAETVSTAVAGRPERLLLPGSVPVGCFLCLRPCCSSFCPSFLLHPSSSFISLSIRQSAGTVMWDNRVGQSSGRVMWDNQVGQSCGTVSRDSQVGKSGGTVSWDSWWVEHSGGTRTDPHAREVGLSCRREGLDLWSKDRSAESGSPLS